MYHSLESSAHHLGKRTLFRATLLGLGFITFLLLILYGKYAKYGFSDTEIYSIVRRKFVERPKENTTDWFTKCDIMKYDAWEMEIIKNFNPHFHHKKDCKPFEYLTKLENKQLKLNIPASKNMTCHGRCLNYKTESELDYGEWIRVQNNSNHEYNCEVVQALCSHSGTTDVHTADYGMLHAQFLEKKDIPARPTNSTKYNVFVLLLDSIGHLQAMRNFPRTMYFLEKSMSAIPFPHVNRISPNSAMNAIQLFLGKTSINQDRTLFGLPNVEGEMSEEEMCVRPMSKEDSLIFKLVNDEGYMTSLLDETDTHAIGFGGCVGFDKQLTDHDLLPFGHTRKHPSKTVIEKTFDNKAFCLDIYKDYLKFFGEFVEAYKGIPKFGFTWLAYLVHDEPNGGTPMDADIYEFLLKHKETIDNSFFIMTADHGFRMGSMPYTKSGSVDVNNPTFIMSVPKELRSNEELMATLRENAKYLQTHLDSRATILDIVKYQKDFQDFSTLKIPGEHGHSYLRKQPQPRNCVTLQVPLEFCMCDLGMQEMNNRNSSIAVRAGRAIIDEVNRILLEKNLTECVPWTYSHVKKILSYKISNTTNTYNVYSATSHPYDAAEFSAVVRLEQQRVFVGYVERRDQYKNQGDCVPGKKWRQYCYCKNQKQG